MGELGLDGSVRPVPGALPIAEMARDHEFKGCILPYESAVETSGYRLAKVFGVKSFLDVLTILEEKEERREMEIADTPGVGFSAPGCLRDTSGDSSHSGPEDIPDFSAIYGQEGAKRGLEVAAAGGHNAIMIGPPGSGKSTLARAIAGILPPMTAEESLQTSKIYSATYPQPRS